MEDDGINKNFLNMNEILEINFQKICRTCVIEKQSLQTIFHVIDMLKECTSLEVSFKN